MMINEQALLHNVTQIRQAAPSSKILAMIKANAYGHGLLTVAKTLSESVEGFGVACLAEAVMLRKAGISQKIVIMRGVFDQAERDLANTLKLDLVVHDPLQLSFLSTQTHWVKINTGMNRLGFSPDDFLDAYDILKKRQLILMTHFTEAEDTASTFTHTQIRSFEDITRHLSYEKSLANSAGILNFKESHADWVRPGLILYGVSPVANKTGKDFNLQPVMTFKSQLINVRMQKKGDRIGYNGTYLCEENMPIGIVGIGYGDGYPRHAQTGTPVLVEGMKVPLIGRVSMDMLAVDLRKAPNAHVGNRVVLWGEGLPIEKVAPYTASNTYELLCNMHLRGEI